MKFTLSWLKEYLDTNATLEDIINTLNKIGLEVNNIIDKTEKLKQFNCVTIVECENHQNSDHLHICKVKTANSNTLLNIVCGAPNARTGLKTILAPIGSILPNGIKIEKSKIRGIISEGMLCSEKELGINTDKERGIIEINQDIEIGKNISEILKLNDPIIDIDITPNRGDCLGVYGIARDLACAGLGKLKSYDNFNTKLSDNYKSNINLNVTDENCPLFIFKEIKNLKNCESPEWLKNRLKSVDINCKNALVDISNYVMLSFNKPLHCYDLDKISNNEINIRTANNGEEFVDLFDKKYTLPKNATVICDDNKILCLGGIIGAKSSSSSLDTTHVLVESAIFDSINTAKTGRKLNIQTDSRYRFERGSDYNTVEFALNYACKLITEICSGDVSNTVKYEKKNYKQSITKNINLDINYIEKLLGIKIDKKDILNILNTFGYKIIDNNNYLSLEVPLYKNNIIVKEDIIDDIVRIYGYDKLKNEDFMDTKIFEKDGNLFNKKIEDKLYKVRQKLIINGFIELITYSFLNKKDDSYFAKINNELDLINPITSDLSHMRQSMLTNILNVIKKNINRGFNNLSFFEIGKIYNNCKIDDENNIIAGIRYGKNEEKNIYNRTRLFDVFDVKKDLSDAMNIFNINCEKMLINREVPSYYHPNRSGAVFMGKILIAYFGELHPNITKYFELKQRPVAFEFFVDKLPNKTIINEQNKVGFKPNDFQMIERDLSFIIEKNIESGNIIKDIYNLDKEYIQKVNLFDIYQEKNNNKSIAFNIKIQPNDKNLSKEDIDNIIEKIINLLKIKYNATLRDK